MTTIPLYTGRAAIHARTAAYWLSRESMWDRMGGPLQDEGKAFCRARRSRNLQLARQTDELNRRTFAVRNEALARQTGGAL